MRRWAFCLDFLFYSNILLHLFCLANLNIVGCWSVGTHSPTKELKLTNYTRKRIMDQTHLEAHNLPSNCQNGPQRAFSILFGCEFTLACAISTSGIEDSLKCSKSTLYCVLFDLILLVSHFSLFV